MRKRRIHPATDTGSFADISFLLLIFFMVVTTFNQQYQLTMRLPLDKKDNQALGRISSDRLLKIYLNKENQVLLKDKVYRDFSTLDFSAALERITKDGKQGVISLIMHPEVNYETYLKLLAGIQEGKNQLRRKTAGMLFGVDFINLSLDQKAKINEKINYRIIERETTIP